MKFTILGSGGCVALPKPLCQCDICKEARIKGVPYARHGCSLFLEDLKMLVDTPEDIVHALNRENIDAIDGVMFSHMDPDHTLGMRLFEHIRLDWFEVDDGRACANPVDVYAMPHVMSDLNLIRSKYGSFLDYYEGTRNLIKRNVITKELRLKDIKITFVQAESATVFVFEQGTKKVVYAPCDVKPFPVNDLFDGADVLIVGSTIVGSTLKNGHVLNPDGFLRRDLFSMEEIEALKAKYHVKTVIVTHIEEDWGKSYQDYLELQSHYEGILFAYDGMKINV